MLVEDCNLFVFFFFKQPPPPVAVTGPSDCTLLVAVGLGGPGARRRLLFLPQATPGGEGGRFQTPVLSLVLLFSSLLGPIRSGGLLPELRLKMATQHWLGTRAELVATRRA